MTDQQILPDDELEELPPMPLALGSWHIANGARMVPFAGYHMPIQYADGIMAEHRWTREQAGLFDVSHMGQLMVTGEGAVDALEAVMPGNIRGLEEGKVRYSLLLNEAGGILDDLMVTRAPQGYYLVVNGAVKYDDMAHLEEHLPDEITLNYMDDRALLALQGPRAAEALASVVGGVERLFFMEADCFIWRLEPLWISRSGYTGEDGFEISLPETLATDFVAALTAHEAVKPIGLGARDSLRLEAGLPLYGHDMDDTTGPVAADLKFAIAKRRREEASFLGAEAVHSTWPAASDLVRVGLNVEGRQPVREGALVVDDAGNEIGRVTSGGFSPTLERPIAMAYVPRALAAAGGNVMLQQRGKLIAASITPLPFVQHKYHRANA